MKNPAYYLFTLITITLFSFMACVNSKEDEPPIIVCPQGTEVTHISKLNLEIGKNNDLEYLIGMDDNREYQIIGLPYNAEINLISPLKTHPMQFVYHYSPKKDFVGKDSVAIIITTRDTVMEYPSLDTEHILYLLLDIKDEAKDNDVYNINVCIPNSDNTYEFFLGSDLQQYKYKIVKEPLNAKLSDIIISDNKTHEIFYNYIPKKRFTGKDYVEIERMKLSTALSADDMEKRTYCISIEVI